MKFLIGLVFIFLGTALMDNDPKRNIVEYTLGFILIIIAIILVGSLLCV